MRFLDLFAGIGGFSLGLSRAGLIPAGQVEIDIFCRRILDEHWPKVPKWGDIKTINPEELPAVDLVCGGYPCQPFSNIGYREGKKDDRHLWPYAFEIVKALRPAWCLFENVAGHVSLGLDTVLADLVGADYSARALMVPACAVGAPHRRDRVWILAHTAGPFGRRHGHQNEPEQDRQKARPASVCSAHAGWSAGRDYPPASRICRVSDGLPKVVDRDKALGNAVVPQVVEVFGRAILAAHHQTYYQ